MFCKSVGILKVLRSALATSVPGEVGLTDNTYIDSVSLAHSATAEKSDTEFLAGDGSGGRNCHGGYL